jgi:hypothetical protein
MIRKVIHYGFGLDYLKDWGLEQALREIYQNFIDYGKYKEKVKKVRDNNVMVTLSNDWKPANLDFLRIGNSRKKEGSIGKHGEGMKMAFMIFQRNNLYSQIVTHQSVAIPSSYYDEEIGECFSFEYFDINSRSQNFIIQFVIDKDVFYKFRNNIITEKDVEFTNKYYGDIVAKPKGSVYSGGLFVALLPNLSRAYNIRPEHLQLDRDRSVPRSIDVNWAASKILDSYEKWNFVDETYDDTQFISTVPEHIKHEVKPVIVGSSVEFVRKNDVGEEVVITNSNIKEVLKRDNFFQSAIKKLKQFVAKKLGLYDMLIEFREKHVHNNEARIDFDLILERLEAEKVTKN